MISAKALRYFLVIVFLSGMVAILGLFRTKTSTAAVVPVQEIEKLVRRHESLQLDSHEAARQVRADGHLSLTTPAEHFDLELQSNDLRTSSYRAEEVVEGGAVRYVAMDGPVRTFRGTVRGLPGAEARFTIDDEKIEGVIITSDEFYYVEPMRNFNKLSAKNEYALYKSSDVIEGAHGACATIDARLRSELAHLSPEASEGLIATSLRQADLATEADYDYVSFFGSSGAANAEILSIVNQVDGIYQQRMGITIHVSYQHSWATSADPYSAAAADQMLYEFTNYWNANMAGQPRDLAHLFTNRPMEGNVAGIAWLGTVCNDLAHSYGVSERVSDSFKYAITAHEIGHNFGASHPDDQSPPVSACANTIMNSIVGSTFDFCQFSLDEMNNYLGPNSSCLAVVSSPATIQFSGATYAANEGALSVVITVTRAGDTANAASVDYKTTNGTASARTDYMTAIRTMTFAAGESSKTFRIFLVDDLYVESDETINVSLSNPSAGTVLGNPGAATVTVTDNDLTVPTTNPLDNAQFFVRQHYLDFLNREADSAGLSYWSGSLTPCGADRACLTTSHTTVSAAFFVESEFQETGYYVYRLYKASLGKAPVFSEFVADRSRVVANSNLDASKLALAQDFVTRPAFVTLYPAGMAASTYVDQLNAKTANSLTQTERDSLVNGLVAGTEDRASVLKTVAENQVFRQREYNAAFVSMQYFGYLRRNADQAGYDFWLGVLNSQPNNFRGMVCSFLTSAEYQLRFSPVVTTSNVDCGQ
ncbi:MAG: hypothetical protein JWM21_3546 [Acidobacteria bacterium]|nr:hypothetical protein [Acidobacteriota bacterium]